MGLARYWMFFIINFGTGLLAMDNDCPIDLNGVKMDPIDGFEGRALVLFFVSEDCPISNRYVPRMKSYYEKYQPQEVGFYFVYPNFSSSLDLIKKHINEYKIDVPTLLDQQHFLVARSKVEVTPECAVFVLDDLGHLNLVYRGRIDDQYVAFGKWRQRPHEETLGDVLAAVLRGEALEFKSEQAIGCYISN